MSNHCTKPDRDEPKLQCGYPLPCPHHSLVIDGDLERSLTNLRYLSGRVSITTYLLVAPAKGIGAAVIRLVTHTRWSRTRSDNTGLARREVFKEIPLSSTLTELRNALEEQQVEARAWLEEHYSTPATPVSTDEVAFLSTMALDEAEREGIAAIADSEKDE